MKIGRNDPCHCGSGQKYKKCHLPADDAARSAELAAAAAAAAAAQAKADAEAEAEKDEEGKAAAAGDRPVAARPKDAGVAKPRAPAPTQAPAFRRKSV
jgi:SEC-C motif